MTNWVRGLHHITGAATDGQKDHDFYTGPLGLRMVKKTINHETADQWHFFYGDYDGNAGTIMTNFIFDEAPLPPYRRGRGSITEVAYSVPAGSLDYWGRGASLRTSSSSSITVSRRSAGWSRSSLQTIRSKCPKLESAWRRFSGTVRSPSGSTAGCLTLSTAPSALLQSHAPDCLRSVVLSVVAPGRLAAAEAQWPIQ